jgi:nucleotide-binding universal stress UspA family protein
MFDKILVAVGGEDATYEPARVAGRLACLLGSELTIMSVHGEIPEALGEPYYSDTLDKRLETTDETLDRARRAAESEGAVVTDAETLEGPAAERIVGLAEHGGYGLIVMGTRRRGRFQAALLGSVSASVAAHSSVPVMVVPDGDKLGR